MDARTSRYHEVYRRAQQDPEGFWGEAARAIDWIEPPQKVFDPGAGVYGRWFAGGVVNTCWNAVDRHVERGHSYRTAIIYDSPVTGSKRKISYGELLVEVSTFAGVLREFGVGKGDRVVIYMPMVPETVVAMLATTSIGAVWASCSPDFGWPGVLDRFRQLAPKVLFCVDGYQYAGRQFDRADELRPVHHATCRDPGRALAAATELASSAPRSCRRPRGRRPPLRSRSARSG